MPVEFKLSLAIVFAAAALTGMLMFIYYQRIKWMRQIQWLRVQNNSIIKEVEMKSAMRSELSAQRSQKARELTSGALSMILKQNTLVSIKSEIETLTEIHGDPLKVATIIGNKVSVFVQRGDLGTVSHWDDFIEYFQILYPNYLANIKKEVSHITDKELKLAALLRLGLDTKKIANLLNLQAESIKVFRHRLRKKLRLPEDANLYIFLSRFD